MGPTYQYIVDRIPLIYVFMSGIGFSIQTLFIKLLKERGFQGSFQLVFARGFSQLLLATLFIYFDADRLAGKGPKLFGNTNWVRFINFMRGFIGYGGIAFAFLSVELIPMGDSTVLVMLSPLVASIAGFFILGEPWRLPEFFATLVSLTGAVLVAKPSFLFGKSASEGSTVTTDEATLGVIYGLIAALSAGFAYVFVRMLGTTCKMPWANVCFMQALCQIFLSVPSLYLAGQHITFDLTFVEVLLIVGGGFVGAWSQIAMTIGMQREKSALATGMRMSDVVFGFLWQDCFTSDEVSVLSLIGALLVTSSIVIMVVFKQSTPPPATTDPSNNDNKIETASTSVASSRKSGAFSIEGDDEDELDAIEMTTRNPISSGSSSSKDLKEIQIGTSTPPNDDDAASNKTVMEHLNAFKRIIKAKLRRGISNNNDSRNERNSDVEHKYSTLAQTEFKI